MIWFVHILTEFEESESDSSSGMDEYGWDDDSDMETKKPSNKKAQIKRPPSLDKYMDIMDRELSKTEVGKSFEKQRKSPKKTAKVGLLFTVFCNCIVCIKIKMYMSSKQASTENYICICMPISK